MPDETTDSAIPPTLLGTIAHLCTMVEQQAGRPAALIGIPRELAVLLAGERAEECRGVIDARQLEALMDGRRQECLMVIPDGNEGFLPILAMPMVAPMVCAWTWPLGRYVVENGFCEHPEYPTLPFSKWLWDNGDGIAIPAFCDKIREQAVKITSEHPATLFVSCLHLMEHARPLHGGRKPESATVPALETLPDDEAIAWQQFLMGLDDNEATIQKALVDEGGYGLKLRNCDADFLAKVKGEFATRFNALAECSEADADGFVTVTVTPNRIINSAS